MPAPEEPQAAAPRQGIDWRGWLMVGWAAWFGTLYALMMLRERAPGLLGRLF